MKTNKVSIIMYHYVRDLKRSCFPNLKALDTKLFKAQIQYLMKYYNIISMEALIYSIENQTELPDKALLLTFDDAYIDHYITVFPILDELKIKGSFYVPAKAIQEHTVLDVNKIHFILATIEDHNLLINELRRLLAKYKSEYKLEPFEFYFKKLAVANRFDTKEVIFIKRLLQVELVEDLRMKIVDSLFEKYLEVDENTFSRELYMNEQQLSQMASSGMHIGNHGYSHYWWNRLNKEEMAQELDLSLDFLSHLEVDMGNWTACYPYGSYDEQSISLLKERNCKVALTTEVGIATTERERSLLMPRLDTNDIPKNDLSQPNEWYKKA